MTDLTALVQRLEVVAVRMEKALTTGGPGPAGGAGDDDDLPRWMDEYDEFLNTKVKEFIAKSEALGGDVAEQAAIVKAAFDAQRQFLVVAATSKKPSDADLPKVLEPTSSKLMAVQQFREDHRKSKEFNHLSAVSEGIPALGWVMAPGKPSAHVMDMKASGEFYANRVLKEFREKDDKHVKWSVSWMQLLVALSEYCKQNFPGGLVWNNAGGDAVAKASSLGGAAPAAAPAAAGGAPPPPPMPTEDLVAKRQAAQGGAKPADGGMSSVFGELSKGLDVTRGLKKVTADMQTHKNPNLRAGSTAPAKTAKAPAASAAARGPAKKGPPKLEQQGNKWIVENQDNNKNIVIEGVDRGHSIYIYKCDNCAIQVKGKCNNIILDTCKKTGIVFENLVSGFESVNNQSVQVQVLGSVPIFSIDKTDGIHLYLSKEALTAEIVSAKSSEMNVSIPGASADDDMIETPLPEQFRTTFNGKQFVTTAVEHAG